MHTISVSWDIVGGTNGEGTCVGPGTLTIEQVKNFSFNSGINPKKKLACSSALCHMSS